MGRGGARPGAGRPKGAKDSPLVLTRTLTNQEARTINGAASVLAARTRLAAWQGLSNMVANLAAYPVKEQTAILALAMRYAGDHHAVPVEDQDQQTSREHAAQQVRTRLDGIRDRMLAAGVAPLPIGPDDDDGVVDAELVWPTRELTQ